MKTRVYKSQKVGNNARMVTRYSTGEYCLIEAIKLFFKLCFYYPFVWPIKKLIEYINSKNKATDSTVKSSEQPSDSFDYVGYIKGITSGKGLKINDYCHDKEPFWMQKWFKIILGLFFPLLLIPFIWIYYDKWSKVKKILITALMCVWGLTLFGTDTTLTANQPEMPNAAVVSSADRLMPVVSNTAVSDISIADVPRLAETTTAETTTTTTTTTLPTTTTTEKEEIMVWVTDSGSKYHYKQSCSRMKNPYQISRDKAISWGYEPCNKCA